MQASPARGPGSNYAWQESPRGRPNSITLANRHTNPSGSPDGNVNDSAPPSSPDTINTPFSMDVNRLGRGANNPAGNQLPLRRGAPLEGLLSPSSSPAPRGRRLSQGARPLVAVTGSNVAKSYSSVEALQHSRSTPSASGLEPQRIARQSRGGLAASASPGPNVAMSPPPVSQRGLIQSSAASPHRLAASPFGASAGSMGGLRRSFGARTGSPESHLEFDAAGRPLASILSV